MTITYPTALPAPLLAGYAINHGNSLLRSQMDSGAARQRRIFRQTPAIITLNWQMSDQQFDMFNAFYVYDTKNGQGWFGINLKLDSVIREHQVRFTSQTKSSLVAQNLWQISATLETLSNPVISQAYYDLSKTTNFTNLYNQIDRYGQILTVTLMA